MRFFISYSRTVKSYIRPVIDLLRGAGHEVWWDADIPEIADWWATILDHIEWSQVFIFVVSEKSVQSPYCLAELDYATNRNRPILPFVIDDHTKYTLPDAVTPMRNQWFIYDGDFVRTHERITNACEQLQWERYRDLPTPRPPEPGKGSGSLIKEFQAAVGLAENLHFDEAIKRFRNIASLDFANWGEDCNTWIARVRNYSYIAEMVEHKATFKRAEKAWKDYLKVYDVDFDPMNIHDKIITPKSTTTPIHQSSENLLSPLFKWVYIPSGKVTLQAGGFVPEGGQTFKVPAFWIAKYPVTNAQFAKFIEAGGYHTDEWWTPDGLVLREKYQWTEPAHREDGQFTQPDYPIVGVSWYEAVAFCLWLHSLTGEPIGLPPEQYWQRAAQGDDDRIYPWGNTFDAQKCNRDGLFHLEPVTKYEGLGDSPFGVVDMCGNVLEWCSTIYDTGEVDLNGTHPRVLRGSCSPDAPVLRGGRYAKIVFARSEGKLPASNRGSGTDLYIPGYGYASTGFRIARTEPI
jgi:formylglycine-generating enzyme required for sulfatase activity